MRRVDNDGSCGEEVITELHCHARRIFIALLRACKESEASLAETNTNYAFLAQAGIHPATAPGLLSNCSTLPTNTGFVPRGSGPRLPPGKRGDEMKIDLFTFSEAGTHRSAST